MDTDEVRRIREKAIGWELRTRGVFPAGADAWDRIVYTVLDEYRRITDASITAMAETPWPEGMSAVDQLRAMHNAAIDAVIGPRK